jgi:hypothetical protein
MTGHNMDFDYTEQSLALQEQFKAFYAQHIIPRWREWQQALPHILPLV